MEFKGFVYFCAIGLICLKVSGSHQSLATAVVQVYHSQSPNGQKWNKRFCGVVCFVKDNPKRSYFIRLYDLKNQQMLTEQETYSQFKYKCPRDYFHTFEGDDCQVGLNFASEHEASKFKQAVEEMLLKRAKKRMEKKKQQGGGKSSAPPANQSNMGTITVGNGTPLSSSNVSLNKPAPVKENPSKSKKGGKDKKKKLTKEDISTLTDFRHVSHVGWDPNTDLDMKKLDPDMRALLEGIGINDQTRVDEETLDFIYEFVDKHGGINAVRDEMAKRPPPPPTHSHEADVNAQDKEGDTPLHYSQKKPNLSTTPRVLYSNQDVHIQMIYFLLENGVDLYKKNNKGETLMDFVVDPNMKQMIERSIAAYKTAPAKSMGVVRLPIHWKEMTGIEMEMVELNLTDEMQKQEFWEVQKQFEKTLPHAKIEVMKRIQNPLLWEHYTLKKRELEKKYGQGCANELHLYHGTKPEIVEIIANDNFDFRIAGTRVGALYGDGTYFATTAKYSDRYASADNDGNKVMFVAKVLAGQTCLGQPGLKRPPEVDPNNFRKGMYDSVVNNVTTPSIYCVFDKNQYYPEYLILYR